MKTTFLWRKLLKSWFDKIFLPCQDVHFTVCVSSLETTIFRQTNQNFRRTFLCSWLILYFLTLMRGNTYPLLPPITVWKYGINQEQRKVHLKLTLTNKIISQKIVVSRLETLYNLICRWFDGKSREIEYNNFDLALIWRKISWNGTLCTMYWSSIS